MIDTTALIRGFNVIQMTCSRNGWQVWVIGPPVEGIKKGEFVLSYVARRANHPFPDRPYAVGTYYSTSGTTGGHEYDLTLKEAWVHMDVQASAATRADEREGDEQ